MAPPTIEDTTSLVEALAAQLRGDLLIRGDDATKEKFDAQRSRSWNKDLSIRTEPIAFAMVSGVKDVVTAVKFCATHDIPVTVRGKGAHSPWGMAQDSLCIDLSSMDNVRVDPQKKLAYIAAGALGGDVDHETSLYNLITPTGTVSHTGYGGLALGGGMSHASRWLGAAVDNFVELELVQSTGEVIRVNAESDPELFWALRGNGFNFGVVTEIVVQCHDMPNNGMVRGAPIAFPDVKADVTMLDWLKHISSPDRKPDESVQFGCIPTPDGNTASALVPVLIGGTEESRKEYCDNLATFGDGAVARMDTELPYVALQAALDDAFPHQLGYYDKGSFLDFDPKDEDAMKKIVSLTQQAWDDRPEWSLGKEGGAFPFFILCLDVGEGQLQKADPSSTSFSARTGRVWYVLIASWDGKDEEEFETKKAGCQRWVRKWAKQMEQFKIVGGYSNDYVDFRPDSNSEELKFVYPGDSWKRLEALKAKHDPTGMFKATKLPTTDEATKVASMSLATGTVTAEVGQ
uniref:FAD-binding PCMH-type domain-containing protein n=1 Tax=Minutocellus polymorphus TaxID=265543 RepID=A0A7S0ARG8_9STRA|mmetsp:Transcript_2056/g.3462  ORF Transcript_2056/g.3462 Transcript_2056/m.3462 type:complete len:517 (+) Transcript_2056:53-1603(+)